MATTVDGMPLHAADRSVVIVGAGLAGARTAGELRAHGHRGRLTVLGAEGIPPYDRPPLSKELLTRPDPAWLTGELGLDLSDLADEVHLDAPARRLLRAGTRWRVETAGPTVEADDVVLATGAAPSRPWPEAHVLHTAADAERLRPLLPGARVVIVGAGWIGAEVAGVAAGAGALVTVIEAEPLPHLHRFGPEVAALLADWYAGAGVLLRPGTAVADVRRHGSGPDPLRVVLDDEELPTDVVLAAVGVRPVTGWLAGVVTVDGHGYVPTDRDGRVLSPGGGIGPAGLWAVGDCATRDHPGRGPVPGGHWSTALHDPEVVAAALLGTPGPPDRAPYAFSTQLGHDLALLGVPRPGDRVLLRHETPGGGAAAGWTALYLDSDAPVAGLRAILLADAPRLVGAARRILTGPDLPRVDTRVASDPGRALRDALV